MAPPSVGIPYQGSSVPAIKIPKDSPPELDRPSPTLAAASTAEAPLAKVEPAIRILPPRTKPAVNWPAAESEQTSVASTTGEPRRLNVPTRAIDIMDLPKAGSPTAGPGSGSEADSSGFRLVSGTESTGGSHVVRAAASSSADYGHDPDYGRLRGRLEYSQIDRRWKLRYIPVNGQTDRYGGSVILSDPKLLGGYERGDFVEIHGRVGQQNLKRGFAPTFEVAEVKRLK